MKDKLTEFINENREGLDHHETPVEIWNRIDTALNPIRKISLWNSVVVWRYAAALFIALSGFLLASNYNKIEKDFHSSQSNVGAKEFKDLELFYSDQISEKMELVSRYQSQTGMSEDEITQNMKKLEAMYLVLKDELKTRPTPDVKDALILNLLIRIDLLNQQLNKFDKTIETHTEVNS